MYPNVEYLGKLKQVQGTIFTETATTIFINTNTRVQFDNNSHYLLVENPQTNMKY